MNFRSISYICSEYNKKHNSQIATKVNVLHTKTVSVGTALQFLDNEYLIGSKDNMIKVDVSAVNTTKSIIVKSPLRWMYYIQKQYL